MDWANVIITIASMLLTSGGLVTVVTLKDRKSGAVLDNLSKMIESADRSNSEWQELTKDETARREALSAELERKDAKIDELRKRVTVLMEANSKLSSRCTFLTMMRCMKVGCAQRIPPFGDTSSKPDTYEAVYNSLTAVQRAEGEGGYADTPKEGGGA